ncbi:hypothetical protein Godav_014763 [Gossypium davidsonii]|uniref:DUF4283 domain-containing protein n=1 Tax=Gossypium davidsonii TaxID=34287 RepID=A0A7J8RKT7_GOSDV|nr:hypothetical protein [Gossypium davidsonii]
MEDSIVNLKIHDRVEEVWAVEEDVDEEVDHDYCLVGCFLTTRMVNFQAMKNTLVNVWHLIGGVVISDLDEKRFLFKFYHEVDIERVIKGDPWTFNNHLLIIHRLLENEDLMEGSFEKKEKLMIPSGKQFYAKFQYEKLTLFCFLCGRLSHSDNFCSLRIRSKGQELELRWDVYLKVQDRRATISTSVWLREDYGSRLNGGMFGRKEQSE